MPLRFVAKKPEAPVPEKAAVEETSNNKAAPVEIPSASEPQQEQVQDQPQQESSAHNNNSEVSPFQLKLNQLQEMGFPNTSRNIELLVKHNGDLILTIKDLLEEL